MTKPDFSVVDEEVVFRPVYKRGTSALWVVAVPLPLGLVLEEGEGPLKGFVQVLATAEDSAAAAAGVAPGDVLRACTAVS